MGYLNKEKISKDSKTISELINNMQSWMSSLEISFRDLENSELVEFISNFSSDMKIRLDHAQQTFKEMDTLFDQFTTEYFNIILEMGFKDEKKD